MFELDVREQGTFQHDVLAEFHEQLQRENRRWRDITPREARERIGRIAEVLAVGYRDGLLHSSEQTRFMLRVMTGSLQDFIETLVGWMRGQYQFDCTTWRQGRGTTPTNTGPCEGGHHFEDIYDANRSNSAGA